MKPEQLGSKINAMSRFGGRIPPQAIDMEQVVLGACIDHTRAIERIEDDLLPEMMYKEAHNIMYGCLLEMRRKKIAIDMYTFKDYLSSKGILEDVGGLNYIIELTSKVASDANLEHHARAILKKYHKREAIKVGDKMVMDGFDETVSADEILEDASKSMSMLVLGSNRTMVHMPDKQVEAMKRYEGNMKLRKSFLETGAPMITGIPCGLREVDALTRGWQNGHLIIKAARPGVGKTSGAVADAIAAAESGAIVAFFSLEMTEDELHDKIIGYKARISPRDIADGNISTEQLRRLQEIWSRSIGIHIDETPAVSLRHVRANGRRMRKENPGKKLLIIIDYLQLMSPSENVRGRNREQEVAEISKGLKELAKELKCPIIALSQLNRSVETRGGDKKPVLADLRESGAIEQDADIVIFHYRASMSGITEYEDGSSTKGTGEYLVKKNRGGPLKDVLLRWEAWCRGWINLEDDFVGTTNENAIDDLPDPNRVQPKPVHFGEPSHSEEQPPKKYTSPF
jgi:replicative DNA helicase